MRFERVAVFSVAVILCCIKFSCSHSISWGYAANCTALTNGTIDVWVGSYHDNGTIGYYAPNVNTTEGNVLITGCSSSSYCAGTSKSIPFTKITTLKPSGLLDGSTNFFAGNSYAGQIFPDATTAGLYNVATGVPSLIPRTWEGITATVSAGYYKIDIDRTVKYSQAFLPYLGILNGIILYLPCYL